VNTLEDNLINDDGWSYPLYKYNMRDVGTVLFHEGTLAILHEPLRKYHPVSAQKSYQVDITQDLVLEFGFRMKEILIGANMYTTILIDGQELVTVGINGEQHWEMFKDCLPKPIDDELFFSSPVIEGSTASGKKSDLRVKYDRKFGNYTDWIIFSIRYEGGDGIRHLRIFIDNQEIDYYELDELSHINNTITSFNLNSDINTITVEFSMFSDGNSYGDPSIWRKESDGMPIQAGFNNRGCHAHFTPAVPVKLAQPKDRAKASWMIQYDRIIEIINKDDSLSISDRIWNGIYGSQIQLEASVLMGAIPLPPPTHIQWTYQGLGEKYDDVKARLEHITKQYSPFMPMEKKFIWDSIYSTGYGAVSVYWGYLTPEELRTSPQWIKMSIMERLEVPEIAIIKPSEMQWDFVKINVN
jgi:hypothetical protein